MSATSCTCIRDAKFVQLVLDPTCPALELHLRFPAATATTPHPES
jgi:hypothetical protein